MNVDADVPAAAAGGFKKNGQCFRFDASKRRVAVGVPRAGLLFPKRREAAVHIDANGQKRPVFAVRGGRAAAGTVVGVPV